MSINSRWHLHDAQTKMWKQRRHTIINIKQSEDTKLTNREALFCHKHDPPAQHSSPLHTSTSELTCSEWPAESFQIGLWVFFFLALSSLCLSLSFTLSPWRYTDVLQAAHPSFEAWHKCINLSAKWYVVLLFPPDSDVLSPLRRSLCLTELQWEIWGRPVWLSAAPLSLLLSREDVLSLSGCQLVLCSLLLSLPSVTLSCWTELMHAISPSLFCCVSIDFSVFLSLFIDLCVCVTACAASSGWLLSMLLKDLNLTRRIHKAGLWICTWIWVDRNSCGEDTNKK